MNTTREELKAQIKKLQAEYDALYKLEKEKRFKNRPACPFCNQTLVFTKGFYNGRERFRCSNCKKSYTARTGTELCWIHKTEAFEQFNEFVLKNGYTKLRVLCEMFDISMATASLWRRKIFDLHHISIIEQKKEFIDKKANKKS